MCVISHTLWGSGLPTCLNGCFRLSVSRELHSSCLCDHSLVKVPDNLLHTHSEAECKGLWFLAVWASPQHCLHDGDAGLPRVSEERKRENESTSKQGVHKRIPYSPYNLTSKWPTNSISLLVTWTYPGVIWERAMPWW